MSFRYRKFRYHHSYSMIINIPSNSTPKIAITRFTQTSFFPLYSHVLTGLRIIHLFLQKAGHTEHCNFPFTCNTLWSISCVSKCAPDFVLISGCVL